MKYLQTEEELAYLDWLVSKISIGTNVSDPNAYSMLLTELYCTEFTWTLFMDKNRAADGESLRSRFAEEDGRFGLCFNYSCTVLEMMVALADRCEVNIMSDPAYGDRTGDWFWLMIDSLGLYTMYDENYDPKYVKKVIRKLLNREYKSNGEGGLFTVNRDGRDMRKVEIWYQLACWLIEQTG